MIEITCLVESNKDVKAICDILYEREDDDHDFDIIVHDDSDCTVSISIADDLVGVFVSYELENPRKWSLVDQVKKKLYTREDFAHRISALIVSAKAS